LRRGLLGHLLRAEHLERENGRENDYNTGYGFARAH
jgi:hypothetical protein